MSGVGSQVSVVVLTYQRNDDLLELLPLLDHQLADLEQRGELTGDVLVVDNDPDAAARDAVGGAGVDRVRYVHEPAPGIAHARNRALDETGSADLLVFIDDDERPSEAWLARLLATYRSTGAAAVAGLVVPDYAHEPDAWTLDGGFFVRQDHPEGTAMPAAGTGNLLLDLRQVRDLGVRFDERFGLTGGSDHLFTRTLIGHGGRIVWSEGASVVDKVPEERLTHRWILRRQFRVGNTWSRTGVVLARPGVHRLLTRVRLTARGALRMAVGGARVLAGRLPGQRRHHARGSRTLARGRGMVSGAWGVTLHEYQRPGR